MCGERFNWIRDTGEILPRARNKSHAASELGIDCGLHEDRACRAGVANAKDQAKALQLSRRVSLVSITDDRRRTLVMPSMAHLRPSRPRPGSLAPPQDMLSTRHNGTSPAVTPPPPPGCRVASIYAASAVDVPIRPLESVDVDTCNASSMTST